MSLKKLLLWVVAGLACATSVLAQVNTVPSTGLITGIVRTASYSAHSVGLVPAASATDLFCISAGSTKNIHIRRIIIGGTAGTAITTPFLVYLRSTADTGGTAATNLALPVAAPNISTDPASTATVTAYTANPTVAASPVLLGVLTVDLPVTTAAGGNIETIRTWGTGVDEFHKGLDLPKGSANQICVNLNGVSVSSGVLNISMDWQESY